MRSLRVRTHRGQVVVTGGGVPIAMTADEARAFARAVVLNADETDPIQRDRAFGEEQTPDVPAPNRHDDAAARRLANLNQHLDSARIDGDQVLERVIVEEARCNGYDLRPGARWFSPIGKPGSARETVERYLRDAAEATKALNAAELEEAQRRRMIYGAASYEVDVRAGAINLVDVDR